MLQNTVRNSMIRDKIDSNRLIEKKTILSNSTRMIPVNNKFIVSFIVVSAQFRALLK